MATGAVYSTPARPLPRSSLSRGAFKFKKSPRHCSWRCTALGAVGVATLLSLILCYCIGTPLRSTASALTDTLYQQHLYRAGPTYSRFPLDRWNAAPPCRCWCCPLPLAYVGHVTAVLAGTRCCI